jgi:hypothetical protein
MGLPDPRRLATATLSLSHTPGVQPLRARRLRSCSSGRTDEDAVEAARAFAQWRLSLRY